MLRTSSLLLGAALSLATPSAFAADQTVVGRGNADAARIAASSERVQEAVERLNDQAGTIGDDALRAATQDALDPQTCIQHRANLTEAQKDAHVAALVAAGLANPADGAAFPGGLKAGIYPPVVADGTACPQLPQPFDAAPGSGFTGHHAFPGGLALHEAFNEHSAVSLGANYKRTYGGRGDKLQIDRDLLVAAPIWHDWAKTFVFQWNADGTEFAELNFGGKGSGDAWGGAGDSRTGAHHILGVAETMKRGLSPAFVIAQASAHAAPTLGGEFKVVNWLRAAAILADVDPVATGYLATDAQGRLRLPALRKLGTVNLNSATPTQTNYLAEYTIHNLSDGDFNLSIPAMGTAGLILSQLAPRFGFDPANAAAYNVGFRNPVLSNLSGERIQMLLANQGLEAVAEEISELRQAGVF